MLDPRKLATLVAVARTGSIADAALTLDVTASAASQHISSMERRLGVALLDRGAHKVRLSLAGQELVAQAGPILQALADAERTVIDQGRLGRSQVRVGAFASAATGLLAPLLVAFERSHPHAQVLIREVEPEHAVPQVHGERLDAAIVHRYSFAPDYALSGLARTPLVSEAMLLALPAHHRLADTTTVTWTDVARERWIASTPAEGFQAALEYAARRAGFTPLIAHRCDTHAMTAALVRAGAGLALVPESAVGEGDGVVYRPIDTAIRRHVDFVRKKSNGDPAVIALQQTAELIAEHAGRGLSRMR